MTLHALVRALGGDLYAGGRRANIPAPGHSAADRSVSLILSDGRVIIHGFGAATWREVRDDLRARGLIDTESRLTVTGAAATPRPFIAASPRRLERQAVAQSLWAEAGVLRLGAPAGRYCRSRAALEALGRPWALRSHPTVPISVYRPSRLAKPALISGVQTADGALTAVEITYLTAGGQPCPRLRAPRKIVGVLPAGVAVRLAPAGPDLLVAEGVFTTLSAMKRFDLPGWALLSTGNLRRWSPPEGVHRVLIAADRGGDGETSAAKLQAELRRRGLLVAVRLPPEPFGDWNDWARACRDTEGERREQGRPRARL